MEFVKVDRNFGENLFQYELALNHDVYLLKNDKILGYGFIMNSQKDTIYFHILEEYRGNGYGTMLFHNLLEVVKKSLSYKDIELSVRKDDLRSKRILEGCCGVEVLEKDNKVFYVVPLKKKSVK